jgi:NADH-quinone oxidoreductase subunit J
VTLLIGLILAVVGWTVIRAIVPDRPWVAFVPTVLAGAVILALFYPALATVEFWAGLVGFVAILSALLVVIHPNPMMSVLFLILNLFCIALFYLMLQAEFLAALQIIVYAGAIMVLFLFVVMLLNLKAEEGLRIGAGPQRWGALGLGLLFSGMIFRAIQNRGRLAYFAPESTEGGFGTAREVAGLLFTRHVFAFEAASILLVAAMVGAVVLAKRRLE